jgi:hypothetical protein
MMAPGPEMTADHRVGRQKPRRLAGRFESLRVPADAPMPFRKEWRRLVTEDGAPNRRLYETAVLAILHDKLCSDDIWVERPSSYRRFDSYLLPSSAVPAAGTAWPAGNSG